MSGEDTRQGDGLEPFNAVQTLETVTIKVSVKAAPKVAIKTFEAALKIGGKALQLGLKSASDKTLINTTLRNPNVPLSKPKRGGWRPTSKYGEGEEGAVHSDDADGQPFSIDGLFDLFSWGSKVKPHPLKPDFSDPLTIPKMENKILKKFGGYGDKSDIDKSLETDKSINNASQSRIDPMFKKKGNVIYHRDNGYKTKINGDGTQSITNKAAKDTFPKLKIGSDYSYPH